MVRGCVGRVSWRRREGDRVGDSVAVEVTGFVGGGAVRVYGHWCGSDAPALVAEALRRTRDGWWGQAERVAAAVLDVFSGSTGTRSDAQVFPGRSEHDPAGAPRITGDWPLIVIDTASRSVDVAGESYDFADVVGWDLPSWASDADDEVTGWVDGAAVSA